MAPLFIASAVLVEAVPGAEGSETGILSRTDAAVLDRALGQVLSRRSDWLRKAEEARPRLFHETIRPAALIETERDDSLFLGWKAVRPQPVETILNRKFEAGESFVLDFGDHRVGHLTLSLRRFDIAVSAPVRLKLIFGESLREVSESFDTYDGSLAGSWLQDEMINIDTVPQRVRLPRRYAFRYVKVNVVACDRYGKFGFDDIFAETVTSADEEQLVPFEPKSEADAALDRVSLTTLRGCMQTVFEDGPKRDRRLWLGDLKLQALANYATYRNNDLVKRSLYLHAGTASEEGLVATCLFEEPQPMRGGNSILDYTALFAPTVLEYLEATGDVETAEDLWPMVLRQLHFTLGPVGGDGLFRDQKNWWLFIDWDRSLEKETAEQAIIICGLKATHRLGVKLGMMQDVAFIPGIIERMEAAAMQQLWDEDKGVFVSGKTREVSWASQAWMVLAEVPSKEQARRALQTVMADPVASRPVTPYLHHYFVEALFQAGLRKEAETLLRDYWGGMVEKGADTFWEVYLPDDAHASPYGSPLMNSYCHAWSCTPTWFLRTRMD
jgi:alpha-L-rhamnosidase